MQQRNTGDDQCDERERKDEYPPQAPPLGRNESTYPTRPRRPVRKRRGAPEGPLSTPYVPVVQALRRRRSVNAAPAASVAIPAPTAVVRRASGPVRASSMAISTTGDAP